VPGTPILLCLVPLTRPVWFAAGGRFAFRPEGCGVERSNAVPLRRASVRVREWACVEAGLSEGSEEFAELGEDFGDGGVGIGFFFQLEGGEALVAVFAEDADEAREVRGKGLF